ncbi:MAG: hypothetical protein Q8P91_01345 [bacterium]|nr:hypothetical protein [bacterium]
MLSHLEREFRKSGKEYKDQPFNPELLTESIRAFWEEAGHRIGKNIVVDKFPLGAEKIKEEREQRDRMAIFVPDNVNWEDLGKIFPEIGNWGLALGNPPFDIINNSGWLWIEASVDAPNRYITPKEGSQGQSLKTYIIGSQISKLLTGKYFDQDGTSSKLLGCFTAKGSAIRCRFEKHGYLVTFYRLSSKEEDGKVGSRFEEKVTWKF